MTLPHGDPVAVELTLAIQGGDLDALRHIVADRPELASAHMIGREGLEGGWRTPLHAATDWPGYFPAAPAAVAILLRTRNSHNHHHDLLAFDDNREEDSSQPARILPRS